MPELPEVETVCRGIRNTLSGTKFVRVQKFRDNLRFPFPANFTANLEGRKIIGVSRRAKYILIHLDNNNTLIVHLGMSGRIVIHPSFRNQMDKHDHVVFQTDNGMEVVFNDPRRFGMMDIVNSNAIISHKCIKDLGFEPLEDEFDGEALYNILKNRKIPVKLAIMNANLVVGVGNIYACESLFRSKISPIRAANGIMPTECNILSQDIKTVLGEAIIAGGSTLRDYVASSGEAGYFQHNFNVYGKEGQKCTICQHEIARIVQAGRSTFFCKTCQV